MPQRLQQIPEEIWNWLLKILLPALVGLSTSIAIKMKNKRMKFIHIFLSLVVGIGTAYLTGGYIIHNFSSNFLHRIYQENFILVKSSYLLKLEYVFFCCIKECPIIRAVLIRCSNVIFPSGVTYSLM